MKKKVKITIIIITIIGLLLIGASVLYMIGVSPVDRKSDTVIEVEIKSGMNTREIGQLLEDKNIIRNKTLFLIYLKFNKCPSLKASTYDFTKSESLQEVVDTLCKGNVYNKNSVRLTFKEGKRFTDYAELISSKTNNSYDDVINTVKDTTYLNELIKKYWFLTDEILNKNIYYPLEGYLAPDTYEFNKDDDVKKILEVLLNQTDKNLSGLKSSIQNGKRSIHEYITLASITELEGVTSYDRKMIVGVFNNRLQNGMNIGSDVTTYYAFQKPMNEDLESVYFSRSNPYNTRATDMIGKLPVGPVCNPSLDSLEASVKPNDNEYFYFVADKNGKIYYNKTNKEHEKTIQEIKKAGNWIW